MTQLTDVLDRMLGLELGTERDALREFEQAEDRPLPEDTVEGVVRRCADTPAPSQRRWRRRIAVALPIVLALAAAIPFVWEWSGRRSTDTLSYGGAFETLRDRSVVEGRRRSALGTIHSWLQMSYDALKAAAERETRSGQRARRALATFRAALDLPLAASQLEVRPLHGRFERLVDDVQSPALSDDERADAIAHLEREALVGIAAMKWARGEGDRFKQDVDILFGHQRDKLGR